MKKPISLSVAYLIFIASLLLSACGGGSAFAPTATIPSILTITPQPEPTLTSIPTLIAIPVAGCKLKSFAFTNVGLGLPNPSYKLPSLGTVKTIVLFADFSDSPAGQSPQEIFSMISPNAEKFFSTVSYGRMNWTLEPHLVWLRLSHPSAYYGDAIRSYEGHLAFIQEAVNLADADVDFSTTDSVVVMVPPQASDVGYGPAFGANEGQGYTVDGKMFSNGVTSGADLSNWGFLWLNHESGHTLGLPDLYAFQYDTSNYDDLHRFVGGFGLMGFIGGKAPEYFAFERWQLGWLDDEQIACRPSGEKSLTLTAVEIEGGLKAMIIPLSNSKAIVIESRRPLGYDSALVKSGAVVYVVDTSITSGAGPLIVYPILKNDPYREQSPLAVGESVTVENVTVTVLGATDQADTVQVTVSQ